MGKHVRIPRRVLVAGQLNQHYESYLNVLPATGDQTFVPGDGNVLSPVVFIGEAPGEQEDRMGKPFIGKSGNLLSKWLKRIGLNRQDVFITNLVKHRPPGNADPSQKQASAARMLMRWELSILKPRVVVPVGRFATEVFYPNPTMAALAGTARTKYLDPNDGCKKPVIVFPMYHPAAALRSASVRETCWEHVDQLGELLHAHPHAD